MKIRTSIILLILVFISSIAFGQDNQKKAKSLYDKGITKFEKGKYKEADSLFRLSVNLFSNADTYYNIAMTRKKMGDTCEYCKNLKKAANLFDFEARDLFEKNCLMQLHADFNSKIHSDSLFYGDFTICLCTKKITNVIYSIKNQKSGVVSSFNIGEEDSLNYDPKKFPGAFPELSKFEVDDTPIFTVVENMPSYPGGDDARIKFLQENITYPQMAKEKGIQGTVYVTFVIASDGKITDIRVLRGIGGGCDEESVRVVKLMPKWKPGYQSGKPVRVQFNMPIKFSLN